MIPVISVNYRNDPLISQITWYGNMPHVRLSEFTKMVFIIVIRGCD
jgi:hypothetical protein